jgi:hypothetical protein
MKRRTKHWKQEKHRLEQMENLYNLIMNLSAGVGG